MDWREAFDRQSPTVTVAKFISLGLRSSLVSLLMSNMTEREMCVKWGGVTSCPRRLVGGASQGTLLGGAQFLVSSFYVANSIEDENKF